MLLPCALILPLLAPVQIRSCANKTLVYDQRGQSRVGAQAEEIHDQQDLNEAC